MVCETTSFQKIDSGLAKFQVALKKTPRHTRPPPKTQSFAHTPRITRTNSGARPAPTPYPAGSATRDIIRPSSRLTKNIPRDNLLDTTTRLSTEIKNSHSPHHLQLTLRSCPSRLVQVKLHQSQASPFVRLFNLELLSSEIKTFPP